MGYASYLFEQEKNKGHLPGQVTIYVTKNFNILSIITDAIFKIDESNFQSKVLVCASHTI